MVVDVAELTTIAVTPELAPVIVSFIREEMSVSETFVLYESESFTYG